MFSQNPRPDAFRLTIPDTFFIDDICDKYNLLLKQKDYVLPNIQSLIRESIQSIDSPDFGYTVVTQNTIDGSNAGYEAGQPPKESNQKLTEKVFQITFRHTDGFLTYFCLLEHFFKYFEMGPDNIRLKNRPTFILETLLPSLRTICRIKYNQTMFSGIVGLNLTYSGLNRDASTFSCTFSYTTFETSFELPDLKLKAT